MVSLSAASYLFGEKEREASWEVEDLIYAVHISVACPGLILLSGVTGCNTRTSLLEWTCGLVRTLGTALFCTTATVGE